MNNICEINEIGGNFHLHNLKSEKNNGKPELNNDNRIKNKVDSILLGNSISDLIIKSFIDGLPISSRDDDSYIECFLKSLDKKYFNLYMVNKLIQKGIGYMIPRIFYKFDFEDHQKITEKLIKAGYCLGDIKSLEKQQ